MLQSKVINYIVLKSSLQITDFEKTCYFEGTVTCQKYEYNNIRPSSVCMTTWPWMTGKH